MTLAYVKLIKKNQLTALNYDKICLLIICGVGNCTRGLVCARQALHHPALERFVWVLVLVSDHFAPLLLGLW